MTLENIALNKITNDIINCPLLLKEIIQENVQVEYCKYINKQIRLILPNMIDTMISLDNIPQDWYYKHIYPDVESSIIDIIIPMARQAVFEIKNRSCYYVKDTYDK